MEIKTLLSLNSRKKGEITDSQNAQIQGDPYKNQQNHPHSQQVTLIKSEYKTLCSKLNKIARPVS